MLKVDTAEVIGTGRSWTAAFSMAGGRGHRLKPTPSFLIILAVMLVAAQPVSHVFQSTSITLASPTSGTGSKFSHIVIIVMEDEGIMDISHRSPPPCQGANTPYMSRLANTYGIASQHVSLVHESLPNYVAFRGGDTFGCIDACSPLNNTNIIDRLDFAQITWKAYMEDCSGGCNGMNLGKYEPDHNPFVRFQDILNNTERCNRIVNTGTGDNAILRDLTSDETAPNYAWLTPNLCNNMHTACNGQPELQTGNNYLAGLVPQILNSTVFQTTNSALFITFDEGNGYCPLSSNNEDCVYTIWTGPAAKKAYGSSALYNHYSLLATIEKTWNLAPLTSKDAGASPMMEFFQDGSMSSTQSTSTPNQWNSWLEVFLIAVSVAIALVITALVVLHSRRKQNDT